MRNLGTLPGFHHSEACHINESGQIVGYASYDWFTGPYRALIWTEEGIKDLNDLVVSLPPDAVLEVAYAINDQGQIVGSSSNGPFLLTPVRAQAAAALKLLLLD
jgi:uncharacterized membrane protein